jgi:hypothetical protein
MSIIALLGSFLRNLRIDPMALLVVQRRIDDYSGKKPAPITPFMPSAVKAFT